MGSYEMKGESQSKHSSLLDFDQLFCIHFKFSKWRWFKEKWDKYGKTQSSRFSPKHEFRWLHSLPSWSFQNCQLDLQCNKLPKNSAMPEHSRRHLILTFFKPLLGTYFSNFSLYLFRPERSLNNQEILEIWNSNL